MRTLKGIALAIAAAIAVPFVAAGIALLAAFAVVLANLPLIIVALAILYACGKF